MDQTMSKITLKSVALGDMAQEFASTRAMLERVPEANMDWRPHAKSFTLKQLIGHIVILPYWTQTMLEDDSFDLATVGQPNDDDLPKTRNEILAAFDKNVTTITDLIEKADDEKLGKVWTLKRGDQVIMSMPRAPFIRTFGTSHLIHHRAQLGIYLRMLDVPVPQTYGPTADEGMDQM